MRIKVIPRKLRRVKRALRPGKLEELRGCLADATGLISSEMLVSLALDNAGYKVVPALPGLCYTHPDFPDTLIIVELDKETDHVTLVWERKQDYASYQWASPEDFCKGLNNLPVVAWRFRKK